MYKAQARDPNVAQYNALHQSIPFCSGLLYDRWLKGTDIMLLKSSGNTQSDKLCTILLIEADFKNINNKKLSREGMYLAEKYNLIAPEQAGDQRNHKANETVLNSCLIHDESQSCRKPMAIGSNNAKGCFDCIVHSVAYICLCRFGIPLPPPPLHVPCHPTNDTSHLYSFWQLYLLVPTKPSWKTPLHGRPTG